MKVVLAVLFAISAALSAPTMCAHALVGNEAGAAGDVAHMTADVSGHAQHAAHGGAAAEKTADGDEHGGHSGCAETCEGGPGCQDCAVSAGALPAPTFFTAPFHLAADQSLTLDRPLVRPAGVEPPPPRA